MGARVSRRVNKRGDLAFISPDQNILIIDGGCDQSIVNIGSFLVLSRSNTYYDVFGALEGMSSSSLEVVNAATMVKLDNGEQFILVINQALLDEDENSTEALLQPHQARSHGVAVDDCAKRHKRVDGSHGGQCLKVSDKTLPLHFDGWKCYFAISKPDQSDLQRYKIIELTSIRPYEPTKRLHTRRSKKQSAAVSFTEWQARLGFPPLEVVQHTVKATTQMVKTVEAESRTYMRDHLKARLLPLRPHRINDTCFTDTFFSKIPSVRGFTMFQMFAFWQSKFDVPYLMTRKSQAPSRFQDLVR